MNFFDLGFCNFWCSVFTFQSLCNACGIRYRKKKRVIEGLKKPTEKKKDKTTTAANITSASAKVDSSSSTTISNACVHNGLSDSFKMRLMALGKQVLLQKSSPSPFPAPSVAVKKQRCHRRRKLKEEEQAAFSLMALSCGFVFA